MSSINELFVKHFENICKALVKQPPSVCMQHVACAPEGVCHRQLGLQMHLGAFAAPHHYPAPLVNQDWD